MTRDKSCNFKPTGSASMGLPVLFLLAVGIFFEGGDWPPATFLIRIFHFLLAVLFLLRTERVSLRPNVVDLLVCGLWAAEAASLARADYPWVSYQWFLHHSAALVLYLLVRGLIDPGWKRFPVFLGGLILSAAAAEFLLGSYQRLVLGDSRPWGTLQNPNFLAELLLYGAIAGYFALKPGQSRVPRRPLSVALAFFVAAGIWLTSSRGGFLVALVVAGYIVAGEIGWKRTIPAAALLALAVFLFSNSLAERFLGRGDPYAFERLNMWQAAVRIFREHPWGVGVGHFKYYWPLVRDPVQAGETIVRYARSALTPHSEFFSLLSELGIAGGVAFAGIGLVGFLSVRRASRAADPFASGACAVLLASFLHSFVETNYHIIGLLLLNATALALVSNRLWSPLWQRTVEIRGAVRGACLALLGAMIVYSGMTFAGTVFEWRGQKLLRAGRLDEAERRFLWAAAADPWQAIHPDSASAVRYRLYRSGRGPGLFAAAIESEKEARRRNPMDSVHSSRLGLLHAEMAGWSTGAARDLALSRALWYYDEALKLSPRAADVHYQKALLLRAAGQRGEAVRVMESILTIEPNFAKGWVLLGELLEGEDARKAVEAYERAVQLKSRYAARASDPMEKEFLDFEAGPVAKRASDLKGARKR